MGRGESGFDWKESIRESELEVAYQPKNEPVLARTDLCPPNGPGDGRDGWMIPATSEGEGLPRRRRPQFAGGGDAWGASKRLVRWCGTVWESGRQLAARAPDFFFCGAWGLGGGELEVDCGGEWEQGRRI
jgi:hypothetical protein